MKKVIIVLLFLLLLTSCNTINNRNNDYIKVTDQIGNVVNVKTNPERIVSGYYISSSICLALGLKDKIVGIESDYTKRPIYKKTMGSLIDNVVDVGTAKAFDLEACLNCNPDLVILPKKAKDYAQTLNEMDIPTIVVYPESTALLKEAIELIGKATNKVDEANQLLNYYQEKIVLLNELVEQIDVKKTVYMPNPNEYLRVAAGEMYQNSLIESTGLINAFKNLKEDTWMEVSYEQILSANPDVIIVPTNANANASPTYITELLNDPLLKDINAIKNDEIYIMPSGFEAWDSPVPSGILGQFWIINAIYPDIYSNDELKTLINDFYQRFYGFNDESYEY